MLKIGGATVNQIPFHWENNTGNILSAITAAKEQGTRILCFPELCITGYGCEDVFLSDWLATKAWEELKEIAIHCEDITVCVGLPVRIYGITYNGVCVIQDQKILGITFKQNLANDGVHYEPRWFKPWPTGKVIEFRRGDQKIQAGDIIYEIEGIKVGFEICEDGWMADRPGYRLQKRGVDLILNPSASHFAMGKSILRERDVVLAGAEKFKCAYLFVNLLGNEAGRMIYDGDIIIAHNDKIVAVNKRLSFRNFNLLTCTIDFQKPAATEVQPSQDIKDRNEELTQAISLALFDYLRKSRAKGFVLSLSGGADSSSCAVAVAEMVKRASAELGWTQFCAVLNLDEKEISSTSKKAVEKLLTCAYQGTTNSSPETFQAAKELADSLGATFYHWTIDDEVTSYTEKIEKAIGKKLHWKTDDITLQNIQARSRSPIIWMLANVKNAVLLTTSNRSEGDVGYATMDGDTSGSLAPIAGLNKIFIIQWLKWVEDKLAHTGLNRVNSLQPTAELRPLENKQTDEDDLMPYAVLAEIERHAIFERKSPQQVYTCMKATHPDHAKLKMHIRKFFNLWTANQWKRERIAPSFHLDELNVDPRTWCRFPILSSGFDEELSGLDSL
jgi:NAD+ synthase (glutamine-hydrolysing)